MMASSTRSSVIELRSRGRTNNNNSGRDHHHSNNNRYYDDPGVSPSQSLADVRINEGDTLLKLSLYYGIPVSIFLLISLLSIYLIMQCCC